MDGRGGGGSLTVRLKRRARCPDIPLDESSLSSRLTPGVHSGRSAHYRCARILALARNARENVDGARVRRKHGVNGEFQRGPRDVVSKQRERSTGCD